MQYQYCLNGYIKYALKPTSANDRILDEVTTSILDALLATNRLPRGYL